MIFRWPADSAIKARQFYEQDYNSNHVTDLPSLSRLQELLHNNFSGHPSDHYFDLVCQSVQPPARLLDFGASWGYATYQFERGGFKAEGFEFSRPRAEYGRKHLQLPLHHSWEQLAKAPVPRFDVIFTAHTLEHLYDLRSTLQQFTKALVPGGTLIIVVPNGGGLAARSLGAGWGPFLGETHTMAFTASWFRRNLPVHNFVIEDLFSPKEGMRDRLCDGEELICIATLGSRRS